MQTPLEQDHGFVCSCGQKKIILYAYLDVQVLHDILKHLDALLEAVSVGLELNLITDHGRLVMNDAVMFAYGHSHHGGDHRVEVGT